jgi:hypothetical protein
MQKLCGPCLLGTRLLPRNNPPKGKIVEAPRSSTGAAATPAMYEFFIIFIHNLSCAGVTIITPVKRRSCPQQPNWTVSWRKKGRTFCHGLHSFFNLFHFTKMKTAISLQNLCYILARKSFILSSVRPAASSSLPRRNCCTEQVDRISKCLVLESGAGFHS